MKIYLFGILLFGLSLISCVSHSNEEIASKNDRVIHIDSFPSTLIGSRAIDIWLPSDYDSAGVYAVIYMHDAQMLFDSTNTWNNKEWQVDETMTRLMKEGKIKDAIVVGIQNDGSRRAADYFPESVLPDVPAEIRTQLQNDFLAGNPTGDEYLMFVVLELRPYIDSAYSTSGDQANTYMMGSSMGGLISLYAICEYPKIFGGVACLSTHWPLAQPSSDQIFDLPATFRNYLDTYLPEPAGHKIYFDYGTATLDSLYKPHQMLVDSIMIKHGYTAENWMTKEFPGDEHSEVAWSKRLNVPLEFLLGK